MKKRGAVEYDPYGSGRKLTRERRIPNRKRPIKEINHNFLFQKKRDKVSETQFHGYFISDKVKYVSVFCDRFYGSVVVRMISNENNDLGEILDKICKCGGKHVIINK